MDIRRQLTNAANQVGPRVYQLETQKDTLTFYALGCQGSGASAQKEVAALMNKIASDPTKKPNIVIGLGDTIYESGVKHSTHPIFNMRFDDIYADPKLEHLSDISFILIAGNHDENLHTLVTYAKKPFELFGANPFTQGIEKIQHQIDHSYLPDKQFVNIEAKKIFYQQTTLKVNELPKWNMPARFYSLIAGNTQFFFIDSNTYVKEYYQLGREINSLNQAGWLQEQMKIAKEKGRQTILALHHPPFTAGRRAYDQSDSDIYLLPEDIKLLEEDNFPKAGSYNDLLKECFTRQQFNFDLILTAHDHDLYYFNNKSTNPTLPLTQLTLGGGGGDLQDRLNFNGQDCMGTFLKEYGFAAITIDTKTKKPFDIEIHSTKHHLTFTSDSIKPIRHYPQSIKQGEIEEIEKICAITKKALDKYFDFLAEEQNKTSGNFFNLFSMQSNLSHGQAGVERAHQLWAYISETDADNYRDTVTKIYEIAQRLSNHEHSLINLLNEQIKKDLFGNTLESVYKSVAQQSIKYN